MQVQKIHNNYNTSFGAKLVFADDAAKNLLKSRYRYPCDPNTSKNILDRFEKYMPDHVVEISIKKFRPLAQDWLYAKNLTTGYSSEINHDAAERIYPMNYENANSTSLYALLWHLLNKENCWHNDFWGI